MPIPPNSPASYVVNNLGRLVARFNEEFPFTRYDCFIRDRHLLLRAEGSLGALLGSQRFCTKIWAILKDFNLDVQPSALRDVARIQHTLQEFAPGLTQLKQNGVELPTLDLRRELGTRLSVAATIRGIYEALYARGAVTAAGGVVAASTMMHLLLPEVFVMVDNEHVAPSLGNIVDYAPDPLDGPDWETVVPGYTPRQNRAHPGHRGRWDAGEYLVALMFFKRIISEWCRANHADCAALAASDRPCCRPGTGHPGVPLARIIDKALW